MHIKRHCGSLRRDSAAAARARLQGGVSCADRAAVAPIRPAKRQPRGDGAENVVGRLNCTTGKTYVTRVSLSRGVGFISTGSASDKPSKPSAPYRPAWQSPQSTSLRVPASSFVRRLNYVSGMCRFFAHTSRRLCRPDQ